MRSVPELRNQVGDAHGKAEGRLLVPHSQAELAANVAGAVARFLMTAVENYSSASKGIDSKGRVILKFDMATVWRLRDHAHNAPKSLSFYGEKNPRPALWLVGDTGIYLMSNGDPPISHSGEVFEAIPEEQRLRLMAPAEGCDPLFDEFDSWWPVHIAIDSGSDFTYPIALKVIDAALRNADKQIVLAVSRRSIIAMSDVSFAKKYRS